MRKYRIVAMLLAQTLSQIRKIYGHYESVTGTCDVTVFFATRDRLTQDYGAALLGQTTRFAESVNRDATSKTTRSVNEVGRPLLYPEQFAELSPEIIIAKKGEPPIRTQPVLARVDRRFNHYEVSA
jgi:type IV secretory pathway TraG/TraD family ATPase VirD4